LAAAACAEANGALTIIAAVIPQIHIPEIHTEKVLDITSLL
jgi:hypothetical protein